MLSRAKLNRKPMVKAQAMFFKAFDGAKGNVGGLEASWSAIQITTYAKLEDHKKVCSGREIRSGTRMSG